MRDPQGDDDDVSYDPPENPYYAEAYRAGYLAGKSGDELEDNPYPGSGHERDTTFEDELQYQWQSGFMDGQEDDGNRAKEKSWETDVEVPEPVEDIARRMTEAVEAVKAAIKKQEERTQKLLGALSCFVYQAVNELSSEKCEEILQIIRNDEPEAAAMLLAFLEQVNTELEKVEDVQ